MPGQLNLFSVLDSGEEPIPELIEPEFIEVKAGKRGRKPKANYDEMFANLPIRYEEVDTLTDEEKQCPACGTMMVQMCIRDSLYTVDTHFCVNTDKGGHHYDPIS